MSCLIRTSGLALILLAGCGGSPPPEPEAPAEPASATPAPLDAPPSKTELETPAEEPPPKPAVRFAEGLQTPESVLYDEAGDRYLVSNINGQPLDADNNGYITELSPEGGVKSEKLIAGGTGNVKLDAPKGMGISKGILYVADITVVRKFDLKTLKPKGDIAFPGASFLNDIAVAQDGRIYVSDSGLKAGEKDFEPSGTDAVYVIDKAGKPKAIAKSPDLGGPNGLLAVDAGVLVVTFRSNELYRLDDQGERHDVTKLPQGGLDGIVAKGEGLMISSWQASAVFEGQLGGQFAVALPKLKAPADIALDAKRNRLLVPRFMENAVEAYDLR
jgi:sugar lactone lactonase YvrE